MPFKFIKKETLLTPEQHYAAFYNCLMKIERSDNDTISDIMLKYCNLALLGSEDEKARSRVMEAISKLVHTYYPRSSLLPFGSSANGFGTKGSDIDILFTPSPDYDFEYCPDADTKSTKEREITLQNDAEIPPEKIREMTIVDHLYALRSIMNRDRYFEKVVYIPAKNCPILNIRARASKIACDISCQDNLVFYNTELLKLYSELDDRVKPLLVALRNWAKCLDTIHIMLLSSYAFTLMVVFFLQNTKPRILPSLVFLNSLSDSPGVSNGWKMEFVKDVDKIPLTENTQTLEELLRDFFKFYLSFDFVKAIVCPRTGEALPIQEFVNSTDERLKGFKISCLCIQDPFILNFNVGRNIRHFTFKTFKPLCHFALSILSHPTYTEHEKFARLFHRDVYDAKFLKMFPCAFQENFASFHINLSDDIISSMTGISDPNANWRHHVCHKVLQLLQYGLLIESEITDKGPVIDNGVATSSSSDESEDINSEQFHLLSIQSIVYNRTWLSRQNVKTHRLDLSKDDDYFDCDILKEEFAISKYMMKTRPMLCSPDPIMMFTCRCYKNYFSDYPSILIELQSLTHSKEFFHFGEFLGTYIPKKIRKMFIKR